MTHINQKEEHYIHQAFEVGVILKGVGASLETLLGFALLFTMQISDVILTLIQNALVDDPDSFFARHMDRITHLLNPHFQFYGALYLLSHGIVKAFLVWGLLAKKMWAYPASIAVLILFIAYQLIKILQTSSVPLILLTVFDLAVLWLIYHEYKVMQKHMK